jgi:pimeloyl-ACP methyl ester carboxylesterase
MRVEDFDLDVEGSRIKGKVFYPRGVAKEALGLVILCHGIPGGGAKDPKDQGYAHLATALSGEGYVGVIFNFRGAGESSGDFDMAGWVEDLKSVIEYSLTITKVPLQPILFGFSAGAAVAVHAAAHDERINALLLCGCPADFGTIQSEPGTDRFLRHARELGIISTPGFPPDRATWVKGFDTVRPERWISEIEATRKLIVHGDADDVVPVEHAYRLFQKAQEPKELVIIKNGGHRLRLDNKAMRLAMNWLKKHSG